MEDAELKKLLEETHALARDNHRLLRSVRRHQFLEMFWKLILWLIVLGGAFYSYLHYVVPLAQKFSSMTGVVPSSALGIPSPSAIQNALKSVTGK